MKTLRNPPSALTHQAALSKERRGSVLVVDDDELARSMLGALLTSWGFCPVTVPDGVTALEQLSEQSVRLVLTDYQMPRLNGLQLLARIRAEHPGIPVIVVSGENSPFLIAEAIRIGAFDWITKPFDPSYFENTVKKAWQALQN